MYQQFSQVVYGRNLPTLFSSQNPNRITNSPKTERNSVAQRLLQPPLPHNTWETPCGRMHGGNASPGTFPHKAGKTIKCFLTEHVRSKLLITIGFYVTHLELDSYTPFHAHIFYLNCYLRTHLVSLWIYFCQMVKVSLSSSWMEFTVVTALVCPEAGGSPVWTVGMVWWNLGLYSAAMFAC